MAEPHAQLFMAHTHGAPAPCPFESGCVSWVFMDPPLTHHHMYTQFTARRTSDACEFIRVNLLAGTADVSFRTGSVYRYTNVSRRAILNLMVNPNMSLGFWANMNCVRSDRTSYRTLPVAA